VAVDSAKSKRAHASSTLCAGRVDAGEDPALLEVAWLESRGHALGVLENQTRDVPELDRQLAPLLDRAVEKRTSCVDEILRSPYRVASAPYSSIGCIGRYRSRGSSTFAARRSRAPSSG
jgi:hypothetical protein